MADNPQQFYGRQQQQQGMEGMRNVYGGERERDKGPSTSQVVAVITLLPIGGILLCIAGFILTATLIGMALATPVFALFSPILIPAALIIALGVIGFLTSGAFGLTALSALSWIINYLRGAGERMPEHLDWDYAKQRMRDAAEQVGQKTKDVGQGIQTKAQESGRAQEGGKGQEGGRT